MNLTEKNELKKTSDSVFQVACHFYEKFPFNIVNFIRVYSTGEVFYLCDNPAWIEYYLRSGLFTYGYFENRVFVEQEQIMMWSSLPESDPVTKYSKACHNIHSGLTRIIPGDGYCDYFNLGSDREHFYLKSHLPRLKAAVLPFCEEFYSKLNRLILRSNKHRINLLESKAKASVYSFDVSKRLYLGPKFENAHVSLREIQISELLVRGCSAKVIANQLNIHERTVVNHITAIKKKFRCQNLCALGFKLSKLGIDRFWESGNQ